MRWDTSTVEHRVGLSLPRRRHGHLAWEGGRGFFVLTPEEINSLSPLVHKLLLGIQW